MNRYQDLPERLRDSVLEGRGETRPGLRRAVAARAAELAGHPASKGEIGDIPADLREYVDTASLYAHRLTGEDVEALRRAGYSEDAVFEISLSVAVGAGLARLERGLAALRQDPRDQGGER